RRNNESAEITIYDVDHDISYSICGIPYFLGGEVDDLETLTPRNADWFKKRYNVDIRTSHEVIRVDPSERTVTVKNLTTKETKVDQYDTLVLATGATPITPIIDGVDQDHVFHVRNIQSAAAIDTFIDTNRSKKATIIGAGFIGLEMAEQLTQRGLEVTIIEAFNQVMSQLDRDMAFRVEEELGKNKVTLLLGEKLTTISEKTITTSSDKVIDSDL